MFKTSACCDNLKVEGLLMFYHIVTTSTPLTFYQTSKFLDWSKVKAFAGNKINVN